MQPLPATTSQVLPDYLGGSIVNLVASLAQGLGAPAGLYPSLTALPPADLADARNVVLLVLDGLGHHHLTSAGPAGALRANLRDVMTSVFPSTTATAITAFMTGVPAQQHGLVGWFTYLKEVGSVVAVLPFRTRQGAGLRPFGVDPAQVFTAPPLFDALQAASFVVSPMEIVNSDYNTLHSGGANRHGYATAQDMFDEVRRIVASGTGRQYIYAYYSELDALAHACGIASPQVGAALAQIDALFGEFLQSIAGTDSAVIVTADHGFVDVAPENTIELERHPALSDALVLPLCGERRVAFCYVRPDRCESFEARARDALGGHADIVRSRDLLDQGWFGLGDAHPRLAARIGDFVLLMKDGYAIKDWVLGERHHVHIGHHGGITADEMLVPLIVARA